MYFQSGGGGHEPSPIDPPHVLSGTDVAVLLQEIGAYISGANPEEVNAFEFDRKHKGKNSQRTFRESAVKAMCPAKGMIGFSRPSAPCGRVIPRVIPQIPNAGVSLAPVTDASPSCSGQSCQSTLLSKAIERTLN